MEVMPGLHSEQSVIYLTDRIVSGLPQQQILIIISFVTREPIVITHDVKHVHTVSEVRNHTVATVARQRNLPCMRNLFLQVFTIPIEARTRAV